MTIDRKYLRQFINDVVAYNNLYPLATAFSIQPNQTYQFQLTDKPYTLANYFCLFSLSAKQRLQINGEIGTYDYAAGVYLSSNDNSITIKNIDSVTANINGIMYVDLDNLRIPKEYVYKFVEGYQDYVNWYTGMRRIYSRGMNNRQIGMESDVARTFRDYIYSISLEEVTVPLWAIYPKYIYNTIIGSANPTVPRLLTQAKPIKFTDGYECTANQFFSYILPYRPFKQSIAQFSLTPQFNVDVYSVEVINEDASKFVLNVQMKYLIDNIDIDSMKVLCKNVNGLTAEIVGKTSGNKFTINIYKSPQQQTLSNNAIFIIQKK